MKVLRTLWGLLVDDGRLASILLVALIVAAIVSSAHFHLLGAAVIWLGLIVALWVSVAHQWRLKRNKKT